MEEPERVVALAPNTAQTLWEIGAKEKVVGRPIIYTQYLNDSGNATGVFRADGFTVATERVIGLEPDLVLAADIIPNETVETLRRAGLTVYKFDSADSFADIYAKTNRTGRLVGACEGANRIVAAMQTRVETIRQAVENESEPRVLYLLSGGFVAGNGTFISDIIETAGAENLAANAGIEGYGKISAEVVAQRNPQWIIVSNRSVIPDGEPWASTTALQQNQVIVVNGSYISQPAPRVVVPLTKIARTLHPEAMEQANLSGTPIGPADLAGNATTEQSVTADGGNATANTTTTAPSGGSETTAAEGGTNGTDGNETETSSGNGAGFGVAVAAVALLGTALLARRHT